MKRTDAFILRVPRGGSHHSYTVPGGQSTTNNGHLQIPQLSGYRHNENNMNTQYYLNLSLGLLQNKRESFVASDYVSTRAKTQKYVIGAHANAALEDILHGGLHWTSCGIRLCLLPL